jgi:phospholipid-binding lipoprotein MlaA
VATPLDLYADPWQHKEPIRWRNTGTVVRLVDQRAAVLDAVNLVEDAALDKYEFVRDAYLQRRESKIHDGETNMKSSYDDDVGPTIEGEPAGTAVVKEEQKGAPGQAPAAEAAK